MSWSILLFLCVLVTWLTLINLHGSRHRLVCCVILIHLDKKICLIPYISVHLAYLSWKTKKKDFFICKMWDILLINLPENNNLMSLHIMMHILHNIFSGFEMFRHQERRNSQTSVNMIWMTCIKIFVFRLNHICRCIFTLKARVRDDKVNYTLAI